MQCKGRYDVIRIGIAPVSRACCIINRQQLDYLHSCCHTPVNQSAKVAEITNAIRLFCTQREHRNHYTCSTPCLFFYPQTFAISHKHCPIRHHRLIGWQQPVGSSVVTLFPSHKSMCIVINNHIFIFYWKQHSLYIYRQQPFEAPYRLHSKIASHIPTAQRRMRADDCHRLPLLQLRSRDSEQYCLTVKRHTQWFHFIIILQSHRSEISLTIQMILKRHIAPPVDQHIILRRVKIIYSWYNIPLLSYHISIIILNLIIVQE